MARPLARQAHAAARPSGCGGLRGKSRRCGAGRLALSRRGHGADGRQLCGGWCGDQSAGIDFRRLAAGRSPEPRPADRRLHARAGHGHGRVPRYGFSGRRGSLGRCRSSVPWRDGDRQYDDRCGCGCRALRRRRSALGRSRRRRRRCRLGAQARRDRCRRGAPRWCAPPSPVIPAWRPSPRPA